MRTAHTVRLYLRVECAIKSKLKYKREKNKNRSTTKEGKWKENYLIALAWVVVCLLLPRDILAAVILHTRATFLCIRVCWVWVCTACVCMCVVVAAFGSARYPFNRCWRIFAPPSSDNAIMAICMCACDCVCMFVIISSNGYDCSCSFKC